MKRSVLSSYVRGKFIRNDRVKYLANFIKYLANFIKYLLNFTKYLLNFTKYLLNFTKYLALVSLCHIPLSPPSATSASCFRWSRPCSRAHPAPLLPNALSIAIPFSYQIRVIFMERIRSVMARQMLQRLIAGATEEHCFCAVVKAEF